MDKNVIAGVIAHVGKEGAADCVRECCAALRGHGIEVLLEKETALLIDKKSDLDVPELNDKVTVLVVMGGDGTILHVLHRLSPDQEPKPIVGINLGRLGFLTTVSRGDAQEAVDLVAEGCETCYIPRLMLEVEIQHENRENRKVLGLNEVTFTRGSTPRLIELETEVDGSLVTVYNADGLIVASPTGSTAYSMAAGGPILSPELDAFILTPICPHVLTNRAMVVGSNSTVCVRPRRGYTEIYATVDGHEPHEIRAGDRVVIRRAPWDVNLAILPETSFFEILRRKLKWGGSSLPEAQDARGT